MKLKLPSYLPTPPAAPEGMEWEYRGMGWQKDTCIGAYLYEGIWKQGNSFSGFSDFHYIEAVPCVVEDHKSNELNTFIETARSIAASKE